MKKILTPVLFFAFLHLTQAQNDRDVPRAARDQVILDDLIVDGSECVGFDCVNGESFGFETIRLKENNLRIRFFDTSNSSSFPTRDWELQANETTNGGAEKFSIFDVDAGRTPFTVRGNAINNALYIATGGKIGFGTSTPVVQLHEVDGNTPTLRLEQDGSDGFTPQTWDLAGNETNFFIRDVSNGSKLPFRITPNAPTNSIFVASDGDIGLGTNTPSEKLVVKGGSLIIDNGAFFKSLRSDGTTGHQVIGMDPNNDIIFNRNALVGGNLTSRLVFAATNDRNMEFRSQNNTTQLRLSPSAGNLNIWDLTLTGGAAFKTGGGSWTAISDKRVKKNIQPYTDGIDEVMQIKPVTFQYNGKANVENTEKSFVGVLAQELQEVAPYMVESLPVTEMISEGTGDNQRTIEGETENFLHVDPSAIPYMLINAAQEHQRIFERQQERITELEADLIELKNLVQNLQKKSEITLSGKELGYLGQNTPNPYTGETYITYVIPSTAQKSSINVHSIEGKLIKTINLNHNGKGQIKVNADNLPTGTYSYQLIVDGKLVKTKKMVLTR